MITSIKRWWNTLLRQEYIYVVSWKDDDGSYCCLCFYDVKDALDYVSTISKVYDKDAQISESELI